MEKKSFAKNILGLFVTTDESSSEEKQTTEPSVKKTIPVETKKATVPPKEVINQQNSSTTIAAPAAAGAVDENIAKTLAEALQQSNQEGFDYFEYARTIDALKATITAEPTLFQSAFASATVMGASRQSLVQSADYYLKILDSKAQEFESACKHEYDVSIKSKIDQMADVEKLINQKALMIQELTTEINDLSKKKDAFVTEVEQSKNKIETVKKNYEITWQAFSSRIHSDIEKMNKYLGS